MPVNYAKHVFMSYSRKDEEIMQRILAFLRKQLINVWVDNEYLVPGTPVWEAEIEEAIQSSMALIVICSPDSKQSEWVRREITYAEQYGKSIIPLLVSGEKTESITIALITYQYLDLRTNITTGLKQLSNLLKKRIEELQKLEEKQEAASNTEYDDMLSSLMLLAAMQGKDYTTQRKGSKNETSAKAKDIQELQEVLRSLNNLPKLPIMTFLEVYSAVEVVSGGEHETAVKDRLNILLLEYRKMLTDEIDFREAQKEPVPENIKKAVGLIDSIGGWTEIHWTPSGDDSKT